MKKIHFLILGAMLSIVPSMTAQVNIVVAPDSVFVSLPAIEPEINLPSYITNNSGSTVTIRWTRVVEQEPQGWDHAFCDKNLCYFGTVSSKTFELVDGEIGVLKPVFYPFEIAGVGVMRLYYISETPGVMWADTAVYVAEAYELVGTAEAKLVKDIAVFPSPAQEVLHVVTANATLKGKWRITDALGKIWKYSDHENSTIAGQISVAQLPPGIYFLNVMDPDGRLAVSKRFVVHR
jgi:hypothetical protein